MLHDFFLPFIEGIDGVPYTHFYHEAKKHGGYRLIGAPSDAMRIVQGRLRDFLAPIAPRFYSSSAKRGGRGAVQNARFHAKNEHIITIDFSDAFGSTDGEKLAGLIAERTAQKNSGMKDLPNKDEWYQFLLSCAYTRKGGLIQGSLVSSLLLDWYCEVFVDRPIRLLLKKGFQPFRYSRFADDLTISSPRLIEKSTRQSIRMIVESAGYDENHQKGSRVNLWHRDSSATITGVAIARRGKLEWPTASLSRRKVKELERMLDTALNLPLFAEKAVKIDGKLRYFLDVTRGKKQLNALETRTLRLYQRWCVESGRDATWVTKVLERKQATATK